MIKASDLFKSASAEEVAKRKAAYPDIKIKEALDNVKKTKLSDGSWHVHGNFSISACDLIILKNLNVSIVDGSFYCSFNTLITLEGAPTTVGGDFYGCHNKLTDLDCIPTTTIGADGYWQYIKMSSFTVEEILAICDVKGEIYN